MVLTPGIGLATVSFPAFAPALADALRPPAVSAHPDDARFGCADAIAT